MTIKAKEKILSALTISLIVFSCLATLFTVAKYINKLNGNENGNIAKFVINSRSGTDSNLTISPTKEGSYAYYEFYVSNYDNNSTSEVNQYYNLVLLIPPSESLISLFNLMNDTNETFFFVPFLIYTNDIDLTFNEILSYSSNPSSIPEDLELEIYDIFTPLVELNNEALSMSYIPFTWYYEYTEENPDSENNETITKEAPATFHFNSGNPTEYKHFLVFAAGGRELAINESYNITGMQLYAYSTQLS